jgi:cyclopropane-fatty-acyl-phospholipid synthase
VPEWLNGAVSKTVGPRKGARGFESHPLRFAEPDQLQHGDDNDAGPVSERYVFPDGEPLHLSRITLAVERAGLTVEHVEGFADDYARTVTVWLERFEQAVALAGIERARIWRVYLHAARNGFESGFEGIYQVKCRRP